MSLFGNNNQLVFLLGPTRSGKTELFHAVQDLEKIGSRLIRRLSTDFDNPKFAKAEGKAHHARTTNGPVSVSPKIRLLHTSLNFRDCSGLEESQKRWINDAIETLVKPKPNKWKGGVLGVMLFNICDIIEGNEAIIRDVESTYRDFLETYGREIYGIDEEELGASPEDLMRGRKPRKKRQPFRPPLGFLFVGSHLDYVQEGDVLDAEKRVRAMIADIENSAQHCLELPSSMRFPPSHTVLADLYNLKGRLAFAKDFFPELIEVTKVMKEGMES